MKVVLLGDGLSTHIHRLAVGMSRRGHKVYLLTASSNEPVPFVDEIEIITFDHSLNIFKKFLSIRKILKQLKPDVLHSHFLTYGGYIGLMVGFHPHVVSCWGHDLLVLPQNSLFHRILVKLTLRSADWILPFSDELKIMAGKLSNRTHRTDTVFWGLDFNHFRLQAAKASEYRRKLGLNAHDRLIYSARTMQDYYNHTLLIEAFPSILNCHPNAKMLFKKSPGNPHYQQNLSDLIRKVGVGAQTIWLEELSFEELPIVYSASDLVVSLPKTDGTPITVLEAMACERPVLTFNIPALTPWLIDGFTGFQITDKSELSARIINCLDLNVADYQKIGLAAREFVVKNADTEKAFDFISNIYRKLYGKNYGQYFQSITNYFRLC